MPTDLAAHTCNRLNEFTLSVALDASDPEYLTGSDLDGEPIDGLHASVVVDTQAVDTQRDLTGPRLSFLDFKHYVSTNHQIRQGLLGCRGWIRGSCYSSVPENRNAVRHSENLAQLVRDEDDRLAVIDKVANDGEELINFAWGQHSRRLVEDQDVSVAEQCLDKLYTLLLADRQITDLCVGVDNETILLFDFLDAATGLLHRQKRSLSDLVAQNDILGNREDRYQLEVLVHHPYPVLDRVSNPGETDLFASEFDRALIRLIEPEDDIYQRALSSTILTKKTVNLALVEGEVDVLVGDDSGEGLRYAANLEHWNGICGAHLPPLRHYR
jgi:hypothetical protein